MEDAPGPPSASAAAAPLLRTGDAVFFIDPASGRIRFANPSALASLGRSEAELYGLRVHDVQTQVVSDAQWQVILQELRAGRPLLFRGEHVRADGSTFPVEVNTHLAEVDGVETMISIARDRSAFAEREERARQSESLLATALETMSEGVLILRPDGTFRMANNAFCLLTGIERAAIEGRKPIDGWPTIRPDGSPFPGHELPSWRTLETREPIHDELQGVIRPDGTTIWLSATSVPIVDLDTGEFGGVLVTLRDVTAQEEARARRATEEKVARLEQLGTLAGGIAHDFNNLLTGVYANLSTVLEAMEGQLPEDPREALDEAVASMERARLLTQQLLTFSKGGAPTPECVDLRALLEDIARFDVSRPDLRVALPEGAALYAQADRGQIQQVFSNLLINAAQALEGRDDGLIEVAMEYVHLPGGAMGTAPGDFVRVQVRDNGPGIPQDALHRVFDPYFSTKRNGRGLGLAIAHSVVTSHGGHLDVRSPPGQGAELTVLLPRWDGEVPVVGDVRRERDFDPRLIERVLVMDDDEMILRVARRLLTHLGGRVDAVTDGEAAIARFRDARAEGDPYSLVVLDLVVVGGMGGREAVGRLLALDGQARCVVSSGYADDPVVARPRDYGFACALRKPYGIGELRAMLARWPDPSPPSPTAAVAR